MKSLLIEIVDRHDVDRLWKFPHHYPLEFLRMAAGLVHIAKEFSGPGGSLIHLLPTQAVHRPKTYKE